MKVTPTSIPDVLLIEPVVPERHQGLLPRDLACGRYAEAGIGGPFVQDNHSRSVQGTLRGLHYQIEQPQGKLVRVVTGTVFDVAVDLRRGSPTLRAAGSGLELSEENHRQLWIPPGFAHGFYVLSEQADLVYKCTDVYAAEHERTLRWDDPGAGDRVAADGQRAPAPVGQGRGRPRRSRQAPVYP